LESQTFDLSCNSHFSSLLQIRSHVS